MSQPAKRGRKAWVPPEGVDWTRPAMHIAKDCGVWPGTVIRWLRRNGLPVKRTGMPKGTIWPGRVEPSTLDWTRQDIALAKAHNLTRERIRQIRKAAGLPASGSSAWLLAGGVVTHPQYLGRRKAKP